jgi:GNAT superfamily N-acetyltransferase
MGASLRWNAPVPLRTGTPADAPALAAVQVASWKVAYRGILSDDFLDALAPEGRQPRWEARLSEPGVDVLVWEEDGRILGYVVAGVSRDADADPGRCGEVHALYLLPEAWGKGGGARLCRAALERSRQRGLAEVTLWVLRRNGRARAFYERMGFAADGGAQRRTGQSGADLDEVRYRRGV